MMPNTRELIHCIDMDLLPGYATQVDFGIQPSGKPEEKFGALQWAIKHRTATVDELDAALGDGPALTEIVNRRSNVYGPNPYACTFVTAWDGLYDEEDEQTG